MSLLKTLTSFVFLFILLDSMQLSHVQANTVTDNDPDNFFYHVIIENNLFRPLGWRPKKALFPYQLIGTIVYTGGKQKATAIIQETTAQKKIHFVHIGDILGDTTVLEIQSKKVTLDKSGEKLNLNITPQYLNLPHIVRKPAATHANIDEKLSKTVKKPLNQVIKLTDLPKIHWKGRTVYWNPSDFSREEIEQKLRDQDF